MISEATLRSFISELLADRAIRRGLPPLQTPDENFLETGLVDSLFFLEMVAAVEAKFAFNMNFSELEPGAFSTLRGLIAQCLKSAGKAKV